MFSKTIRNIKGWRAKLILKYAKTIPKNSDKLFRAIKKAGME